MTQVRNSERPWQSTTGAVSTSEGGESKRDRAPYLGAEENLDIWTMQPGSHIQSSGWVKTQGVCSWGLTPVSASTMIDAKPKRIPCFGQFESPKRAWIYDTLLMCSLATILLDQGLPNNFATQPPKQPFSAQKSGING